MTRRHRAMSCSLMAWRALTPESFYLAIETDTNDHRSTAANQAVASKTWETAKRELPVSLAAPADGWSADTSAFVGTDVAAAIAAAVGVKSNAAD